jgi:hypothetical protein
LGSVHISFRTKQSLAIVASGLPMTSTQFEHRLPKQFICFSLFCVAWLSLIVSTLAWSGEIRHIFSLKGKGAIAYFQDDKPGAIVWVYSTKGKGKGEIGYFQKGQSSDITYIYRSNGESPLYFTEDASGQIYIYSVGNPDVWGYFNK